MMTSQCFPFWLPNQMFGYASDSVPYEQTAKMLHWR